METIRERIIQAVQTNLQNIRLTGGYNSDCGRLVLRAEEIGPARQLPAISMTLMMDEVRGQNYGRELLTVPFEIAAVALYVADNDPETQAELISKQGEEILGDLRKNMGLLASVLISDVKYQGGGIEDYPVPRDGELAVRVIGRFNIEYETKINDPYNQ